MTCLTCGLPLRYSGGVDPGVPWVHEQSGNAFCDVAVPEDAVWFAGTPGRPYADPGVEGFESIEDYMEYIADYA